MYENSLCNLIQKSDWKSYFRGGGVIGDFSFGGVFYIFYIENVMLLQKDIPST